MANIVLSIQTAEAGSVAIIFSAASVMDNFVLRIQIAAPVISATITLILAKVGATRLPSTRLVAAKLTPQGNSETNRELSLARCRN